jgi:hypothetical protein
MLCRERRRIVLGERRVEQVAASIRAEPDESGIGAPQVVKAVDDLSPVPFHRPSLSFTVTARGYISVAIR